VPRPPTGCGDCPWRRGARYGHSDEDIRCLDHGQDPCSSVDARQEHQGTTAEQGRQKFREEMRATGVATLEEANRFLQMQFLPQMNAQPKDSHQTKDVHKQLKSFDSLEDLSCRIATRMVGHASTFAFGHQRYALQRNLPQGTRLEIRVDENGKFRAYTDGRQVEFSPVPPRVRRTPKPRSLKTRLSRSLTA
jgi:hypothetical protein